ncbi:hypothetical protein GW17_00040162 [Ensete ventricosum]|nr:hypothetical protein GW17_00040162 [Ensete ventricosum]RZS16328.1 hypothetical protein BHM03_00048313 [Ensete ventricosum]
MLQENKYDSEPLDRHMSASHHASYSHFDYEREREREELRGAPFPAHTRTVKQIRAAHPLESFTASTSAIEKRLRCGQIE